jgi:hypothetical protein
MEFLPTAKRRNNEPLNFAQTSTRPQVVNDIDREPDITDPNKPGNVFNIRDDRINSGDLFSSVVDANSGILLSGPATNQPKSRGVIVYKRLCEDCNKEFTSLVPWARYCNDACKQRAYRTRKANNAKIKQIQPATPQRPTATGKRSRG